MNHTCTATWRTRNMACGPTTDHGHGKCGAPATHTRTVRAAHHNYNITSHYCAEHARTTDTPIAAPAAPARTYAIRGARTKSTGHLRQDGTRTTFCNRPVGAPNEIFRSLAGWKMCTRCVKAEARDRAHAEEVAAQHAEPTAPANAGRVRAEPTAADRAAAAEESRHMAELITEAEATAGTWRGEWIGDTTALFDRPIEQGALFA